MSTGLSSGPRLKQAPIIYGQLPSCLHDSHCLSTEYEQAAL